MCFVNAASLAWTRAHDKAGRTENGPSSRLPRNTRNDAKQRIESKSSPFIDQYFFRVLSVFSGPMNLSSNADRLLPQHLLFDEAIDLGGLDDRAFGQGYTGRAKEGIILCLRWLDAMRAFDESGLQRHDVH
jgi:hypothetical protein